MLLSTYRSLVDASDVKAMVAALTFIIRNTVKYNLESETLVTELQQLGMPKGAPLKSSYRNHRFIFERGGLTFLCRALRGSSQAI